MAQQDYFLKMDGIQGESRDAKHKGEIELVSFGWGVAHVTSTHGGGHGTGRAEFEPFNFTARVSKASPQVFLSCASGKHIKEAQLTARRAGKEQLEYLKIKLTDVLVTVFHEGGAGADAPMESVGLAFGRFDMEYRPQQADGSLGASIKAGWDLSKNLKV